MIGTLQGNGQLDAAAFPVRPPAWLPVAVVALDARSMGVSWIKPIPQCAQPLYEFAQGTFIGRSTRQDALYFFCFTGGIGAGGTFTFPGGTGAIRLRIDPKGTQNEALSFPVEFFPISGAYTGAAGTARGELDRPSDRLFVQSLSPTTPGAWAFDGTISAWVGLIAAPDEFDPRHQ